jgi:hypothetical protein
MHKTNGLTKIGLKFFIMLLKKYEKETSTIAKAPFET